MGIKMILVFVLFICGSALGSLNKHDFRLERVTIRYYDPEYVQGPVTFTSRSKRGDTYKTNVTGTILHTWSHNITGIIYYKNADNNVEHVLLTANICEAFKVKWINSLIKKYSDIPASCDVPAREYHVVNMELKPQTFPLSLPSGEHYIGIIFTLTKTGHVLFNLKGTIHVVK